MYNFLFFTLLLNPYQINVTEWQEERYKQTKNVLSVLVGLPNACMLQKSSQLCEGTASTQWKYFDAMPEILACIIFDGTIQSITLLSG